MKEHVYHFRIVGWKVLTCIAFVWAILYLLSTGANT